MPVFEYQGFDGAGKKTRGYVDAENIQAARAKLRAQGVFPTDIKAGTEGGAGINKEIRLRRGKVKVQDLAMATRQLSTLLASGIPLVESLTALIDQVENVKLKTVLGEIREKVNEGSSLADAMDAYPKIFSNLYVNMVRAGESSGTLELVLNRLADFTESQVKLKNKIVSVMAYPALMVVIGFVIMIILFTYVIPKITKLYSDMGQALPIPTQILINVSKIFTSYWYIAAAVFVLIVIMFKRYIRTEKGRRKWDNFKLSAPLFGKLIRMVAISRFTSTLSTLLASGVPLLKAMDIVKRVVDNIIIAEAIANARTSISEGQTISEPLRRSGQFPPMVIHMIAIGEKSGELESMLRKISENYNDQIDTRIATMTSLIEPLMIAVMGAVVGFIVFAVMMPILNLSQGL